jgi:hypothetical protein
MKYYQISSAGEVVAEIEVGPDDVLAQPFDMTVVSEAIVENMKIALGASSIRVALETAGYVWAIEEPE